jgi:hypothetical protein
MLIEHPVAEVREAWRIAGCGPFEPRITPISNRSLEVAGTLPGFVR